MKKISLIILLLIGHFAHAEFINIGIFNSKKIQSFDFSIRAGKYALYTENGKIKEFESGSVISIQFINNQISLRSDEKHIGNFQTINLVGIGWYNHFLVKSKSPTGLERRYDDNLKVVAQKNQLQLINNIDLDNYVAGVVEAEVGRKPPKEYFKLQAIICRTYALSNTHKHLFEGFNLCDEVHCQAYHGKTFFTDIVDASMQTKGAVIVDSNIELITAAFHSNCGGETVNSEDVWTSPLYYLKAVKDTFCINKKNAVWEKEITVHTWNSFLMTHLPSNKIESSFSEEDLIKRKTLVANSSLNYKDIRNKFQLRSTFFTAKTQGNTVFLKGKGYGHGVGLCQEGAMEMAAQGYNYAEILHFYYSGVHIIDLSALDFFKED
tara:strand:- start:955 stop:2091 length:1137 start_codon:yes stop_codon:yes gene_type:complete